MRLKLSYTVKEEDVLAEAAKLIGISADDVQRIIGLFAEVQAELKGDGESSPNIGKSLEMLDDFRQKLMSVDTRVAEVVQIVVGYQEFLVRPVEIPEEPPFPEVLDAEPPAADTD